MECDHRRDPDAMVVDGSEGICSQSDCSGWARQFAMFGTTIHS